MQNSRISTIAFRYFKEQQVRISQLHWKTTLMLDVFENTTDKNDEEYVVDKLKPNFQRKMLPLKIKEIHSGLETDRSDLRLALLVMAVANFELYLKKSAKIYLAAKGYENGIDSLNVIGDQLGRPILNSSTVTSMVQYFAELLNLVLSEPEKEELRIMYGLRCLVAHTDGLVSSKTALKFNQLKHRQGKKADLDWEKFKSYLAFIYKLASRVDTKIATSETRALELKWTISSLDKSHWPKRPQLWKWVHEEWGVLLPKKYKIILEQSIY